MIDTTAGGLPGPAEPSADPPFFSREERFVRVGSTNDVVRGWLGDRVPEVCLALADEQTAGRGRAGRSWQAPPGAALLCSLGFRPTWLDPERAWQLAAVVALAMADAAEEVAYLRDRSVRLKWPNDLVIEDAGPADPRAGTLRKLAGVLGETEGLGTPEPRAVVGIGINAGWEPRDFPVELASGMTSLHEASGGRPIDLALLLDAFTARIEPRIIALRGGRFGLDDWVERQVTTGRDVRIDGLDGSARVVRALGVDARSGALVIGDPVDGRGRPGEPTWAERHVLSGEIVHVRLGAAERPTLEGATPGPPDPLAIDPASGQGV